MPNYWNIPGVPHKGWSLEDVYDIKEDDHALDTSDYETCMMCGNERIRYIHVVSHPDMLENFKVGCTCAEKMTNDYINPKKLENEIKKKNRKSSYSLKLNWKLNDNGNTYLIYDDNYYLIYKDKKTNKYKIKINQYWDDQKFDEIDDAKMEIQRQIKSQRNLD